MGLREKLAKLFSFGKKDESFYEDIEDILIEGDVGGKNAMEIGDIAREKKPRTGDELSEIIKGILSEKISSAELLPNKEELSVYVVLGVNGVGKTTSIAKLANYYTKKKYNVILAASDTFRAGAIDQLSLHAERLGIRIVKQKPGSDPGAVIYDAITSAESKGDNLILCDTAGRMHNREDLVRELQKIDKIVKNRIKSENYKKILVLDATTGQNAISQADVFNKAVGVDAIVLTKYDSESKGGALTQIGIPVCFVGTGEKYDNIEVFDKEKFIKGLVEG